VKNITPQLLAFATASALAFLSGVTSSSAQTVATVPTGVVTVTIAAGTGTVRTLSVISMPLLSSSTSVVGQVTGRITSLGAATITNTNGGWQASQLSNPSSPHLIKITSGSAIGRTFLISTLAANTADTITIDPEEAGFINLTTQGIATGLSGDTYEIIPCDTLLSAFGTPASTGILGGSTAGTADNIQMLVSGAWRQYYYSTSASAWLRVGPNTNSNSLPIRPDAAVMVNRLGNTPITLSVFGKVPAHSRKALIRNSGTTFVSNSWPVDVTLLNSGISSTTGWATGTAATADIVQFQVIGAWRQYYHNGTQWLRVGPNTVSDSVVVPAGSAVMISKKGVASGASTLSQIMPYTL